VQDIARWYTIDELSAKRIAKHIAQQYQKPCSKQTILRTLKDLRVAIRSREEVARLAQKYPRKPFDGDLGEQLYYEGYFTGDLYLLRLTAFSMMITLTTTVPASIQLFKELFGKYGKIKAYPQRNHLTGGYEWHLRAFLERPSFQFLNKKTKRLPQEAAGSNFYRFLAGFTDAEGSIYVTHAFDDRTGTDRIRYRFKITNQNKLLLQDIMKSLEAEGFHPLLDVAEKEGKKRRYRNVTVTANKDVYELSLNRNEEVIKLLEKLALRHDHKKRQKKLILHLRRQESEDYRQIEPHVEQLRRNIKKETIESTTRAKLHYKHRHQTAYGEYSPPPPFSNPQPYTVLVRYRRRRMSTLQDEVKHILEEATGLRYRVRYHPDIHDPKWDVLLERQLATRMPPSEECEAILSVSGYSNGDIIIEPILANRLEQLSQALDHKEASEWLLGERQSWPEAERLTPRTVEFLRDMDRLAQKVNGDHGSDIELYLDPEKGEWWLQARFNSKNLGQEDILSRIERNVKALLEALKQYHKRIEALEEP